MNVATTPDADGVVRVAGLRFPAPKPERPTVVVRRTYLCSACGWVSIRRAAEVDAHIAERHPGSA